ncbi:glyoxylase-like metal-dependent hydrolase (beta-lactamase superfamily II) [Collimonas sp. PA-H2]|uniref:MBL fold metallo-hydrolase n=1 Tax=Collimonas sp. PA-H2 TaxID=1881062 RepID=UPI000BFA148C|nr:MBL fold metallo-hydrolase [Collimonas sp. PA-H2]PFH11357.1 glyoxylase-like metal-dependent hydrolase (beta-lactamase superfamily II) [Collimonas sp. PA-H2]
MTEAKTNNAALQWELLVKKRNSDPSRVPPGNESLTESLIWITNTVTLLYGERDAMLVDTFLPNEQNEELADWIAASGKNLTMVYITHAHPDHFCGLKLLLDRFPGARAVAPPQVVKAMHATIAPDMVKNVWERLWPGQLPKELIAADVLEGNEFELEGHKIVVVDIGHTDCDHSTCLHVPSIDLVISGDAVYNGAHLYLAESNKQGRLDWLGALDKIEALNPRAVIAGHGVLKPDSDLRHIQATRQYLLDFNRLDEATTTARELYDQMLELYPDRTNPGSLWGGAKAAKA